MSGTALTLASASVAIGLTVAGKIFGEVAWKAFSTSMAKLGSLLMRIIRRNGSKAPAEEPPREDKAGPGAEMPGCAGAFSIDNTNVAAGSARVGVMTGVNYGTVHVTGPKIATGPGAMAVESITINRP